MPPDVREYILIHELMHLRQANHSIRFWRLVEAACPRFRDAERFWRICDANVAMWPEDLVSEPGRVIGIPASEEPSA